ncbi:hypothetical protein D3C81_1527460 [compost metagenome]
MKGWGIGGQCQYAAQLLLPFEECCVQHYGATLRETRQENARRVDATGALGFNQIYNCLCRFIQLFAVDGTGRGHGLDVVPAWHLVAAIDGHGAAGRLGQHEAGAQQGFLQGLGHRQEVVAVGAQAVQPDHTRIGSFYRFKNHWIAHDCSRKGRALYLRAKDSGALVRSQKKMSQGYNFCT